MTVRTGSIRTRFKQAVPRLRSTALVLLMTGAVSAPAAAQTSDATALSLEELLDIPVVGASKYDQKQKDIAAAVSVITRQEIDAFGWRTIAEALASLPGVYTTYDRQYTYLGARGFGLPGDFNTRILLTIDGNRVNDAVYDQAYVGREFPLDMDLVERIEFIPGPGGAVYGQNAMLGTVNVVTRRGASVGGELVGAVQHPQAAGEGRASWGGSFGRGTDALVSVSRLQSRGQDRFLSFGASGVAGVAAGLDGERDAEAFAKLSRGPWSLSFIHGDRRKDDPTGVYLSDPLAPGTSQRDRMSLAQAEYQRAYRGDTLHLFTRLFLGRERYIAPETFGGDASESGVVTHWQGAEWRVLVTSAARHKAMVGMEYQANSRQEQTFDNRVATPGVLDVDVARSGWRTGAYIQDESTLSRALAATLGLRLDRNSVTGNAVSPRAGLRWEPTDQTTAKALYGRAYRAPNVYEHDYDDRVTLVANPGLRGETIDTLELVVDHRRGRDLTLRGSVYEWRMRGLIVLGLDAASGLPRYENGDDVRADGVEVSADKTWDWGGRLRGSATYQRAVYADGSRPNNSPQWLEKLNLSGPVPSSVVRLGYELQCSSGRQAIDGTMVGGYCVSNVRLVAAPTSGRVEFSVGVGNLAGTAFAQPGSRNNWQTALEQDGRSVRAAFRYKFADR